MAAALTRAGEDVTVVARESTAEQIGRQGIDVSSALLGDFTARPLSTVALTEPVEILIVATKSTGLDAALTRIKVAPDVGRAAAQRARSHGASCAGAWARGEWPRGRSGSSPIGRGSRLCLQSSPAVRVELAADDQSLTDAVHWLAATLRMAGIPAQVGDSEAHVLWSKLVRLNALACTTSAADSPIGLIRSDPEWRPLLEACIAETAAVANADGARIDGADLLAELDTAPAELGSSMQPRYRGRARAGAGRDPRIGAACCRPPRARVPDDRAAHRADRRARWDRRPSALISAQNGGTIFGAGPGPGASTGSAISSADTASTTSSDSSVASCP